MKISSKVLGGYFSDSCCSWSSSQRELQLWLSLLECESESDCGPGVGFRVFMPESRVLNFLTTESESHSKISLNALLHIPCSTWFVLLYAKICSGLCPFSPQILVSSHLHHTSSPHCIAHIHKNQRYLLLLLLRLLLQSVQNTAARLAALPQIHSSYTGCMQDDNVRSTNANIM